MRRRLQPKRSNFLSYDDHKQFHKEIDALEERLTRLISNQFEAECHGKDCFNRVIWGIRFWPGSNPAIPFPFIEGDFEELNALCDYIEGKRYTVKMETPKS
jgi:hypothetical protein